MINKKMMQVLVLLLSLTFIPTVVYAKSSGSDSKKYSNSWWHMPFYQVKKATQKINDLQEQISKIQKKSHHLERKDEQLQNQLANLAKTLKELKEQIDISKSQGFADIDYGIDDKKERIICPGCRFQESKEFENFDFSNGFLQYAYFDRAYLNGADFDSAKLKKATFYKAQLQGANMLNADLNNAYLWSTNLCGTALPEDSSLREGITWYRDTDGYRDTICPDNTWARDNGFTCEGEHLIPIKDIINCKDLP